jgi:hypothetical protein
MVQFEAIAPLARGEELRLLATAGKRARQDSLTWL